MSVDNEVTNHSGNRSFEDVLRATVNNGASRRQVIKGGLSAAATGFLATTAAAGTSSADNSYRPRQNDLMTFEPVPVADGNGPMPTVSSDYEWDYLIPWGTPLRKGVPEYAGDPNSRPTSKEQTKQIGIGHDGMWFFPRKFKSGRSSKLGMMCINHEFGRNSHVLGKDGPESLEDVRLSQHAHGVSCVAIGNIKGRWQALNSKRNRRIHVNTPVCFSGPAADSELLKTPDGNIPLGTVNNCGSGYSLLIDNDNVGSPFSTTDRITIKFEGSVTITASGQVIAMGIQAITSQLNTVTNDGEVRTKAEAASGTL